MWSGKDLIGNISIEIPAQAIDWWKHCEGKKTYLSNSILLENMLDFNNLEASLSLSYLISPVFRGHPAFLGLWGDLCKLDCEVPEKQMETNKFIWNY